MKRIGIDARFYNEAGPGRYVKSIIQHLEKLDKDNKYFIFLRDAGMSDYSPQNPNFTKVGAHYKWYSFEEQFLFLFKLIIWRLDLFYVPHFNIPVLYPGKIVTAIPDIIMHLYSTEKGTTLPKPYFKFKKLMYKLVVLWAVLRSKKVIVPSHETMEDFIRIYPYINRTKYILAGEGVDPELLQKNKLDPNQVMSKYGINKPFLLYISSFYEHKNVPKLIESYEVLKNDYGYKGQLVLIGKNDKFAENIKALIEEKNLSTNIIMPGMQNYVTDEETVALRKAAQAYVFPSLKEGFSLTPMEAQAFGLPAIVSDIPCHREIYRDSVLYFDPKNPKNIAHQINHLIANDDLKIELINKGYDLIKKYDWNHSAEITLGTFNKV